MRWETKDGLPANAVQALTPARSANDPEALWIGTTSGLVLLEGGKVTAVPPPPEDPRPAVKALLETPAKDGGTRLFVGTRRGLYVLSTSGWTTPEKDARLPRSTVNALLETSGPDGAKLWVATLGGGIHLIGPTDVVSYGTAAGLPTNGALALLRGRGAGDTVWVGTEGGGVVRLRLGAFRTLDKLAGLPNNTVYAIRETHEPNDRHAFWIATDAGLARFADGRFTVLDRASGLPDASVNALAPVPRASGDALWIGTEGGLARLSDRRLRSWTTADGLPSNRIWALLPSGDDLWIGTHGGLARFSAGRFETWTMANGLPTNPVTSLAETFDADGQKVLWMGTFGGGLAWLEDGEIHVLDSRGGFPDDVVVALHLQKRPSGGAWLWAATRGGAVRIDPTSRPPRFIHFSDTTVPALPGRSVNRVESDGRGRVYVLTNRGVARLTPRTPGDADPAAYDVSTYDVDDGLPGKRVLRRAHRPAGPSLDRHGRGPRRPRRLARGGGQDAQAAPPRGCARRRARPRPREGGAAPPRREPRRPRVRSPFRLPGIGNALSDAARRARRGGVRLAPRLEEGVRVAAAGELRLPRERTGRFGQRLGAGLVPVLRRRRALAVRVGLGPLRAGHRVSRRGGCPVEGAAAPHEGVDARAQGRGEDRRAERGGRAPLRLRGARAAGEHRQEHVPRKRQPRAPDSAERDHRLQRDPRGGGPPRETTRADGRHSQGARRRTPPPSAHRHDPRSLEGRGRKDGDRARDVPGARPLRRGRGAREARSHSRTGTA